jgi:hypothetical protein
LKRSIEEFITTGSKERLEKAQREYINNPVTPETLMNVVLAQRDVEIEEIQARELKLIEGRFQAAIMFLDASDEEERHFHHFKRLAMAYALNGVKPE